MISVVVIDDDFRVAKIHGSFVSRVEGFEVVGVAHTGAEALEVVQRLQPELLLLDLYLPDVFGLDLLNRLRVASRPFDVIVISAANESETVQQAVRLGVTDYLLKPFTAQDLRERLDQYRSQRASAHPPVLEDQSEVDRLFGRADAAARVERLPKGMSVETARLILAGLAESGTALSALECATLVGVSRVSARRYLEHYSSLGLVEVSLRYGSAGRPERRYALVPAAAAP